eukprot:4304751-Lingulodinium_polyedra.AAC.1
MHNFVQQTKAYLRTGFPQLEQYLQADWQWPTHLRQKGKSLHQLFNRARESTYSDHSKTSASDIVTLYPVCRHFVVSVVQPTGSLVAE